MSDTPRTDANRSGENHFMGDWVDANFAKQLERELNAANERIRRLEKLIQERDKEWFQVIESILGFHPVSMTEALHIGIERIKKQKQRIKRLEEAGDQLATHALAGGVPQLFMEFVDNWHKAKEAKP